MNLKQFVVSIDTATFEAVALSVKTYQDMIRVETVSHAFKTVSFEDRVCSLFNKAHKSLECPSLRSIIELEVTNTSQSEGKIRKNDNQYDNYDENGHRAHLPKCQASHAQT